MIRVYCIIGVNGHIGVNQRSTAKQNKIFIQKKLFVKLHESKHKCMFMQSKVIYIGQMSSEVKS